MSEEIDETMEEGSNNSADLNEQVSAEALLQECNEWKDKFYRAVADLENLKKRSMARESEMILLANERVVSKLLPVLDDMQHAIDAAKSTKDIDGLLTGVSMIHDKAKRLFETEGVREIAVTPGQPFDVNVHEALMVQASEHPDGHVVMEVQRGYMLHDRVIRHAKVITSTGNGATE